MDVAELHAKKAVLEQLAHAHDHWSEEEQLLKGQGRHIEAEGAHQQALECLRQWRLEEENPEPAEAIE